jgi:hypothetical protein
VRKRKDVSKESLSAIARAAFVKGYNEGRADGYLLGVGHFVAGIGVVSSPSVRKSPGDYMKVFEPGSLPYGFPQETVTGRLLKNTRSTKRAQTPSRPSGNGSIPKRNF